MTNPVGLVLAIVIASVLVIGWRDLSPASLAFPALLVGLGWLLSMGETDFLEGFLRETLDAPKG